MTKQCIDVDVRREAVDQRAKQALFIFQGFDRPLPPNLSARKRGVHQVSKAARAMRPPTLEAS